MKIIEPPTMKFTKLPSSGFALAVYRVHAPDGTDLGRVERRRTSVDDRRNGRIYGQKPAIRWFAIPNNPTNLSGAYAVLSAPARPECKWRTRDAAADDLARTFLRATLATERAP